MAEWGEAPGSQRRAGIGRIGGVMTVESRQITLASGLSADVQVLGSGPELMFLHNHLGRVWDVFLDALAKTHTVYAPRHPGSDEPD